MPNDLIDFWRQCPLNKAPFVHPEDIATLSKKSRWIAANDPIDFDAYIASTRFGDLSDDRLHLSLRPIPYLGDLEHAEIVILLLNPGFGYSDYWAETKMADYRKALEQNLHQSFAGVEFPFLSLDPQFCWHGGFMWWERKLREVIGDIAIKKFGGKYRDALRSLSQKLACVELIPYHSVSFRDHALIELLPSVQKAKEYVLRSLVPEAVAAKRTLIVTRQIRSWGLTKGMRNVIVYEGGQTRGASLGRSSTGGKAILQRYGISI